MGATLEVKDSISNISRASKKRNELLTKCSNILMDLDAGHDIPADYLKYLMESVKEFLA